jgi:hypothetical protein
MGEFIKDNLLIIFILNVLISFIPANIAKNKGHSFGSFYLISFCFSFIIAFIVVLCVDDRSQEQKREVAKAVTLKTLQPPSINSICPSCGNKNADGKFFCTKCGEKLKGIDPVGWVCKCGVENSLSDKFCGNCGLPEPIIIKKTEERPYSDIPKISCPQCGTRQLSNRDNCWHCGAILKT